MILKIPSLSLPFRGKTDGCLRFSEQLSDKIGICDCLKYRDLYLDIMMFGIIKSKLTNPSLFSSIPLSFSFSLLPPFFFNLLNKRSGIFHKTT